MPASTGLREHHKQTTRRALEDAALRLFARDGYDATTVEAITAAVGVSPRTFFRYFRAKHEVLDMGWAERRGRLEELVAAAPPGLDDLAVAGSALQAVAEDFADERERVRLRARALQTSPTLRGRAFDTTASWQQTLAGALARRRGLDAPDRPGRAAAAVAVAVWLGAVTDWLTSNAVEGDLPELVRAWLAAVRPPL